MLVRKWLTLASPLSLAIFCLGFCTGPLFHLARAAVGEAVQEVAASVAAKSDTDAQSLADQLSQVQYELRRSQIVNLVAESCEVLRQSDYQITDKFIERFDEIRRAEENSLSESTTGRKFLPTFEASTIRGVISIVDAGRLYTVDCRAKFASISDQPTSINAEAASCVGEPHPLDDLVHAFEAAAKKIPGVTYECDAHMRPSDVDGICIPICPETRPLYYRSWRNQSDFSETGLGRQDRQGYIAKFCFPCPAEQPYYVAKKNTCQRCPPETQRGNNDPVGEQNVCTECPYGFETTSDGKCKATRRACEVCERVAEFVESWQADSILRHKTGIFAKCDRERATQLLLDRKNEVYATIAEQNQTCGREIVGQIFEANVSSHVFELCHTGPVIGDILYESMTDLGCDAEKWRLYINGRPEIDDIREKLDEPNYALIRSQVEAGE